MLVAGHVKHIGLSSLLLCYFKGNSVFYTLFYYKHMSVITTCAQTFIICALQQCDSCYSCSHCIWDWCFSLGDHSKLIPHLPFLSFFPRFPLRKCEVISHVHCLILEHHNFKTPVDTIVIVTLISTGSCPCHYCGQVCWDCNGTECIQCSQDGVDTT